MKFMDLIYVSQIVPIISIIFVISLFIYKLYYEIRSRYDIVVNCWFCNEYVRVPFKEKDSWFCPNTVCQQYNGFTKDGGYNKEIVEQFDRSKNLHSPSCAGVIDENSDLDYFINGQPLAPSNGFCNDCNENQRLKVEKLSQFEPKKEKNYDQELKEFKRHLEELYRLCPTCEKQLGKVLREKKKMILGSKFLDFLKKGADAIQRHPKVVLIKKLHTTKWQSVTALLILFLAILHFYFTIHDMIRLLQSGLEDQFFNPIVRFGISCFSYLMATCNLIQSIMIDIIDFPLLKKSFLYFKSIIYVSMQYSGFKIPKFYIDYENLISIGIPVCSIILALIRNILDGFQISRYTILLTIWSINVGAMNVEYFESLDALKILIASFALILSIPKFSKYSNMDVTNNSFHKIYSEDFLKDDDDSISLLSSSFNGNNSIKSFRTNASGLVRSPSIITNRSTPGFKINQKSNSHSPVSPFKAYKKNYEASNYSNLFSPITQNQERQFQSNMELNRPASVLSGYNGFQSKNLPQILHNNTENIYKNSDHWNYNSGFSSPYGFNCASSAASQCCESHLCNDRNSIYDDKLSHATYPNRIPSRSSLLSPSRFGENSCNLGAQSWISGGFFNSKPRDISFSNATVQKNQDIEGISRASSQSSGFESNCSFNLNNGFRHMDPNKTVSANESLNARGVSKSKEENQFDISSRMSNGKCPTDHQSPNIHLFPRNSNEVFRLRNLQSDSRYRSSGEPDWRPSRPNGNVSNGFGLNGMNSFNLHRMHEELTPIERGSLLKKWKEQNCVS